MSLDLRREPFDGSVGRRLIDELIVDLLHRYTDGPDTPEWLENMEHHRSEVSVDEVSPPIGAFLVGYLGEEPVGCGAVRPLAPTLALVAHGGDDLTAEVKRMYTRPEVRGRGVARRLLGGLCEEAARLGYRWIVLETGVRQPEAIALYRSEGFEPVNAYGHYADDPDSVYFGKPL